MGLGGGGGGWQATPETGCAVWRAWEAGRGGGRGRGRGFGGSREGAEAGPVPEPGAGHRAGPRPHPVLVWDDAPHPQGAPRNSREFRVSRRSWRHPRSCLRRCCGPSLNQRLLRQLAELSNKCFRTMSKKLGRRIRRSPVYRCF